MPVWIKFIAEALIVACLLLTNVVMGNFTKAEMQRDVTLEGRVFDALSLPNIAIALAAGFIASFLLWHVVRK